MVTISRVRDHVKGGAGLGERGPKACGEVYRETALPDETFEAGAVVGKELEIVFEYDRLSVEGELGVAGIVLKYVRQAALPIEPGMLFQ